MDRSERCRLRVLCHEHRRSTWRCATVLEMKEGPSDSVIRSLIPSHRKLLRSKAVVVSVAEGWSSVISSPGIASASFTTCEQIANSVRILGREDHTLIFCLTGVDIDDDAALATVDDNKVSFSASAPCSQR
jgi:hypothetical protein